MQLLDCKNIDIIITDVDGVRHEKDHGFELAVRPLENGFACFVNGRCDVGLAGEGSVLLRQKGQKLDLDYVAIVNHSLFWCRPYFGSSLCDIPPKTQELLAYDGEFWHCLLPVCADTFKTVIHGHQTGIELIMTTNCDGITDCQNQLSFVYQIGKDPRALTKSCAEIAADLLGNGLKLRHQRKMPETFEYLGWCSWDALQIRVSHQGLLEKAKEFKEKHIPVHFAIIDDMWANVPNLVGLPEDISFGEMVGEMHRSKLACFEGDHNRFPEGMKAAIDDLKKAGIPKVGIWFPTTGYWAGLVEDGEDAKLFAPYLSCSNGAIFKGVREEILLVSPTEQATAVFFDEYCRRVKAWNGDFVKIDNQGYHTLYQNMAPIGKSARYSQRAIDNATQKYFDGALINCMGMPSECMFNRPNSAVSRCSDDFMPESREWFAKNILQCAYNGLLQGQYYINDWDMWWTDDEQAAKNSLCRAVSGGPIYVSDKIGRSRAEILKPVCFSDGRIPRCDNSATPTSDCLIGDPTKTGRPFKIQNRIGENGIIAVFNIDHENRAVKGRICPEDAGLPTGKYVYYEYFSKSCGVLEAGESLALCLDNNDVLKLYTFLPYRPITVLGRTDLFVSVKAVVEKTDSSFCVYEGGEISIFSEKPIRVFAGELELQAERLGMTTTVVTEKNIKNLRVELV